MKNGRFNIFSIETDVPLRVTRGVDKLPLPTSPIWSFPSVTARTGMTLVSGVVPLFPFFAIRRTSPKV